MEIKLEKCLLRSWRDNDAEALATIANDQRIADNMRDRFPNPYTIEHARDFIQFALSGTGGLLFAVEVEQELAGAAGLLFKEDVYHRSAELGYWVGAKFWNRGIATDIAKGLLQHAFENDDINLIYACVFEGNLASMKVLEKSGFELEAIHKKAVFKNGGLLDEYRFVKFRPNQHSKA